MGAPDSVRFRSGKCAVSVLRQESGVAMASSKEKSPPLTLQNLMPLIRTHRSLWDKITRSKLGVLRITHQGLLSALGIPHSKQHEVREQCSSEQEAVSKCIEWWLHHFTVSWREVIYRLDKAGEMKLADSMRMYGEPLKDRSLNEKNVKKVIEEVKAWRTVGQFGLLIPSGILDRIVMQCSSDDEKIATLANYIVVTLPNVTWEAIAAKLYYWNEMGAVEQAKLYVQRAFDPTLTTANVMKMLRTLNCGHFARVLDISNFPRFQYQSDDQHKEAVVSHALRTHPCLTWKRLVDNLQMRGYNEKAEEVMRKYVKGDSLFHSCVNFVVKNYEFYQPLLPQYLPSHVQTHIHQEWEETRRSMIY